MVCEEALPPGHLPPTPPSITHHPPIPAPTTQLLTSPALLLTAFPAPPAPSPPLVKQAHCQALHPNPTSPPALAVGIACGVHRRFPRGDAMEGG